MFRVRAVNAAGVGMASMASDPVTAKAVAGNVYPLTAGLFPNVCHLDHFPSGIIKFLFENTQHNEHTALPSWNDALFFKELEARSKWVVEQTNIMKTH